MDLVSRCFHQIFFPCLLSKSLLQTTHVRIIQPLSIFTAKSNIFPNCSLSLQYPNINKIKLHCRASDRLPNSRRNPPPEQIHMPLPAREKIRTRILPPFYGLLQYHPPLKKTCNNQKSQQQTSLATWSNMANLWNLNGPIDLIRLVVLYSSEFPFSLPGKSFLFFRPNPPCLSTNIVSFCVHSKCIWEPSSSAKDVSQQRTFGSSPRLQQREKWNEKTCLHPNVPDESNQNLMVRKLRKFSGIFRTFLAKKHIPLFGTPPSNPDAAQERPPTVINDNKTHRRRPSSRIFSLDISHVYVDLRHISFFFDRYNPNSNWFRINWYSESIHTS